MATFTEETTPYEALCRIKPDGSQTWQFSFRTRVLKDGVLMPGTDQAGSAMTAKQAQDAGFPLETILGEALAAALLQLDAKTAEAEEARAQLAELQKTE